MSTISAINSVTGTNGATQLKNESDRATISRSEFLKILVSELTNQDPFKPIDNADFAGQMAQIQSLQASSELTSGFQTLARRQDVTSASAMIGRQISGVSSTGMSVVGNVDSVKIDAGGVSVMVAGIAVPIGSVFEIKPYAVTEG